MKVLSAAFILLLTSVSGVALAADGQRAAATAPSLSASYTDSHVLSAYSDQKSADSESIRCACVVPMTFA